MTIMTITINVNSVKRFNEAMKKEMKEGGSGPFTRSMFEAGWVYAEYLQDRFDTGGGDKPWQPLSQSTIRRKGHGIILVNSEWLRYSFGRSMEIKKTQTGIKIRLQNRRHPESKLSIPQLAATHQFGGGRNPVRETFVHPDSTTLSEMNRILTRGVSEALQQTGAGG